MKSHNERVKLMYKGFSRIYGLLDIICFPVKSSNPRLGLARAIPNEDISVLDVCCGTAKSLIEIASRNDRNRVTGVDLSRDMIRIAEKSLKSYGIANALIREGDATRLGERDNSYDVVTTSLSLHEMPEDILKGVLSEMSRVVKKGGRVCIMEWDRPENFIGKTLFFLMPYLLEPRGFKDFLNLDWNKLLSLYGLSVVEVQKYRFSKLIIATRIN